MVAGKYTNENSAQYLPRAARSGQSNDAAITVDPPDSDSAWRLVGATGSIAWWSHGYGGSAPTEVSGYDAVRRRWIAALPTRIGDAMAMDFGRTDPSGAVYIAGENVGGTAVWRYDAAADRWIAAAPAPPVPVAGAMTPNGFTSTSGVLRPQLVHVTSSSILMIAYNTQVSRYDRAGGYWGSALPLPVSLQNRNNLLDRSIAVAGDSLFAGGANGLYRLRLLPGGGDRLPEAANWTSLQVTATAGGSGLARPGLWNPLALRLTAILPERRYVYALLSGSGGNFAGRLDRATGHWTIDDESRGFPGRNTTNCRLTGDGQDGAWLQNGTGDIYRYDPAADRWRLLFGTDDRLRPQWAAEAGARSPTKAENDGRDPLALIGNNPKIVANGDETDVLTHAIYSRDHAHGNGPTIWRFSNADGHLLGTVSNQQLYNAYYTAICPTGDGGLWVGVDRMYFRVHFDQIVTEKQWQPLTPPVDLSSGSVEELIAEPHGALRIVTSTSNYLWVKPGE